MRAIKILNFFLVFLILCGLVSALGVSPGRVEFDFVPNATVEMTACFSAEGIPLLKIEPIGFLAPYIKIKGLGEDNVLDTTTSSGCLEYTVNLPDKIDKPGQHYSGITAVEMPDQTYGNIYALVKIVHQVIVKVPYPGKYLEITSFEVQNSDAGAVVPIKVFVENKGEENITFAKGDITIYDNANNKIGEVSTNMAKNITKGQTRVLSSNWNSTIYKQGNYVAKLKLIYDDFNNNETTPFKLGGLDLNLLNYTQEMTIGGIKPFYAIVDSIWSEIIPNVKTTVNVYQNLSPGSPVLFSFETVSRDIAPWGTQSLIGYVDTDKLGIGNYTMNITIISAEITKSYVKPFRIVEPPKPVVPKKSISEMLFTTTNILIAMVLLLIIILVIVVIALLPKKKKEEPEKK